MILRLNKFMNLSTTFAISLLEIFPPRDHQDHTNTKGNVFYQRILPKVFLVIIVGTSLYAQSVMKR
jgi:hypothetical protein